MTTAETCSGTLKEFSRFSATALPWVMLPMPKLASTANTAKMTLSATPQFPGRAFLR